jgi:hypothetical protein
MVLRTPLPKVPTLAETARIGALENRVKQLEENAKKIQTEIEKLKNRLLGAV